MGWPFGARAATLTAEDLLGFRTAERSLPRRHVKRDDALKHSAYWACLRLRADLVSTMPLDIFRRVDGMQVEVPTPPVLQAPGGSSCPIEEWMYSTQFDLDSSGNTIGIIKARDGQGLPAIIELVPITDVTVQIRNGVISYRIGGEVVPSANIWHEKQFTASGIPVGLSPTAYAAASISGYLSAQAFATDWFDGGAVPGAHLKNTARTLDEKEANKTKRRFKAAMSNGDVFVSGNDWDYNMIAAKASESSFLEERSFGLADVCRYLGVPGDMIDASQSGTSVTYANITQRNLQLLIMNIGPAVTRREKAFSRRLLPQPRYVKLNTDALLRMDIKSRYDGYKVAVDGRFLAPSEIRELENRPPFTEEQYLEFDRLFPRKGATPITDPQGVPA